MGIPASSPQHNHFSSGPQHLAFSRLWTQIPPLCFSSAGRTGQARQWVQWKPLARFEMEVPSPLPAKEGGSQQNSISLQRNPPMVPPHSTPTPVYILNLKGPSIMQQFCTISYLNAVYGGLILHSFWHLMARSVTFEIKPQLHPF